MSLNNHPTSITKFALIALFVITLCVSAQPGQCQEENGAGSSAVETGPENESGSSSSSSTDESIVVRMTVESDEPAPAVGLGKRIDGFFGYLVGKIELVLFYRLGKQEQQYIQVDHEVSYVRPRGSDEAFKRLNDNDRYEAETISEEEAKALNARGLLVGASKERLFRLGSAGVPSSKISPEAVEYLTIIVDKPNKTAKPIKYVKQAGDPPTFLKVGPMRGLLSGDEDESLTADAVEDLHNQGRLETDEYGEHIQTEWVGGVPVVVLWLALGSIFFTLYMRGVNIWGFRHAVQIVRGKYDNPEEPGEVTHFQALSSALSATVGLGNIAGVTVAMTVGGPGAFFWMIACGLFGMTSKFVECTLGQKYRRVKPDGTVLGGPMQYLDAGLREMGLGPLGAVLAFVFAVMCILASFGGGNMFQANQSGATMLKMVQKSDLDALSVLNDKIKIAAEENDFDQLTKLETERETLKSKVDNTARLFLPIFGIVFAAAVGLVILGGIKRIAAAAEKIVPTMCIVYVTACLWIIFTHYSEVPMLVASIFTEAFSGKAMAGGVVGVIVIGVQRAAFSNEAGVGSASIAHSAAKTEEPVREGAVALLGPFIDTVVVCSMTALVILITGAWDSHDWLVTKELQGAALTLQAFEHEIPWFSYVLSIAILLFAYSTIISWSYYGEKCWERLFGARSTIVYKLLYVVAVIVGSIVNLGAVLSFSDMMILSMAFPNVLGLVLLSPKVRRDLLEYWSRYKAGQFKTFK